VYKLICNIWFCFISILALGQDATRFIVSGYVRDEQSSENLTGVTIFIKGTMIGTVTNSYGFFSLNIPSDSVVITFSNVGYESKELNLIRNQAVENELQLDVVLTSKIVTTKEIVIIGNSEKDKLQSTQMSTNSISIEEAKKIPPILGEVDIVKVLQMKPGIQSGGEGVTGIYVRGGGADQNLFLIDDATVYNANHLFGFFSIFNPDAVRGAELYKGGFPAQYGGRLSSVIDVKLNEGNKNKSTISGGIGIITSRLTFSAPIVKNKGSFIVAARRTYIEPFTRYLNKRNENNPNFNIIPDYFFYDFNIKANYDLTKKDRIFLSLYYGQDAFKYTLNQTINFNWGNKVANMRWNHIFNSKLFMNTAFFISDYRYEISQKLPTYSFNLGSFITDYSVKSDFEYFKNDKNSLKFGAYFTYHNFDIGRLQAGSTDGSIKFGAGNSLNAQDFGLYISDEFDFKNRWKINSGLRLSGFLKGNNVLYNPEPRLSVRYKLRDNIAIKASYSRMIQYVHLVSNSGGSLPTDIWYPSNKNVSAEKSNQIAFGPTVNLFKDKLILGYEFYYKKMNNQLDLKDGAQIFNTPNLESEFVFGKGWAYGNEFYVEKKGNKLHGWISYTLSWNWRKFPDINNGIAFNPRYDQRHNVNFVAMYEITKRLSFSTTFVYGSGNAVTLPKGRFFFQNVNGVFFNPAVPEFLPRNSYRMAPYSRLDIAFVWKFAPRKGESDLTFAIYNVYNRRNPYFIYFDTEKNITKNPNASDKVFLAKQVTLFPIIPTLTYNFKF
jgi:hypothetical protein